MQDVRALSLDWYGTLVKGGTDRLVHLLRSRAKGASDREFEKLLSRREALIESLDAMPFMRFAERDEWILATLYREFRLAGDAKRDAQELRRAHLDVTAYEDVAPFFADLGLPAYVVSNADEDMLEACLKKTGLSFAGTVTSEGAKSYKPSRGIFEAAIREIGEAPEAILHVGDSFVADIVGAKRVGMRAAWLARTGLPKPRDATLTPDAVVKSLRDVLPLITKA